MKINRLIEIIILLLNKQKVTANELISRFGVSMRTVYRDVEELSAAGVPVYLIKGEEGGILLLLPEHFFNKSVLSESERDNLTAALKTMCAVKYLETDTALEKVGALFKEQFQKRIITQAKEAKERPDRAKPTADLHLRFSPKSSHRLYDDFDDRFVTQNEDGSFDVRVTLPEDEWVCGFILSFGNLCEVISPSHIRETVAERLREAVKIYEK